MTSNKEIREALEENFERVSVRKGVWKVKRTFFYTHGGTAEKLAEKVLAILPHAKIQTKDEFWNNWPKDSYWQVTFTVPMDAPAKKEVTKYRGVKLEATLKSEGEYTVVMTRKGVVLDTADIPNCQSVDDAFKTAKEDVDHMLFMAG
jgi:hypothetical protein